MSGTHDLGLVTLAVLIGVTASYTALDVVGRMRAAATRGSYVAWLGAAACSLGGGIWAMHFVAMLAFSIPGMAVQYDLSLTVSSLLLAVAVVGIGFAAVGWPGSGLAALLVSGVFVGLGIAGMHYTGMAAMRMAAAIRYEVVEAKSAEEALGLVRDGHHPDIVVTDHLMSGMSGVDLARELSIHRPNLPVLVISGYAHMDGIAPGFAWLTKPFRSADLAACLAALMPGSEMEERDTTREV